MRFWGRLFFILVLCFASVGYACTVFFLPSAKGPLMGRNFDFPAVNAYVVRNGRGIDKMSLTPPPTPAIRWRSKYGSLSLNQAGFEFPTEGMNEEGLSVAALVWDVSSVPKTQPTAALNQLQWIQYQLDTQSSVEGVLMTLAAVPVVKVAFPLHFSVCDARECAIVEWIDGKPVAFRGATLPVAALANDGYHNSCQSLADGSSGRKSSMDVAMGSADRFRGAAQAVAGAGGIHEALLVRYGFAALDKVSQFLFTQWQSIFDPHHRRFEVRRGRGQATLSLHVSGLDWDDPRPGWIDLDAAAKIGSIGDADLAHRLPAHYCAETVASLGAVRGVDVDPQLLQAIPFYGQRLHPSSKPWRLGESLK